MRIGKLEIRFVNGGPVDGAIEDRALPDLSGVFAVAETEAWWRAVHQIIDKAERETIEGARNKIPNTNMCISAVGAGEGVDLVRQKLRDARKLALKGKESNQ